MSKAYRDGWNRIFGQPKYDQHDRVNHIQYSPKFQPFIEHVEKMGLDPWIANQALASVLDKIPEAHTNPDNWVFEQIGGLVSEEPTFDPVALESIRTLAEQVDAGEMANEELVRQRLEELDVFIEQRRDDPLIDIPAAEAYRVEMKNALKALMSLGVLRRRHGF